MLLLSQLVSDSLTSAGVEKKGMSSFFYFSGVKLFSLAGSLHAAVGERLYSYFADSAKWEAFPDTRKALERIKSAGLKLGAISNFDERLGTVFIHAQQLR